MPISYYIDIISYNATLNGFKKCGSTEMASPKMEDTNGGPILVGTAGLTMSLWP